MIYITADRFFGVLLNIRYPIYWNIKKTKLLLLGNATVTVGVIIALSIKYTIQPFFFCRFFTLYVQAALNFAVLFLFIITYTFIFHRYSRSGRVDHSSREPQGGLRKKLRTSKLYLYFLLMVSFILLCVVPNIYFLVCRGKRLDEQPSEPQRHDADSVSGVVSHWFVHLYISESVGAKGVAECCATLLLLKMNSAGIFDILWKDFNWTVLLKKRQLQTKINNFY